MNRARTKRGVPGRRARGEPCSHAVTRTHDGPYVCGTCGASFPTLSAVAAGSPITPRRFENGATGEINNLRVWLAQRGYVLGSKGSQMTIREADKTTPKRTNLAGVYAFVNQLRAAEGKEPFNLPAGTAASSRK